MLPFSRYDAFSHKPLCHDAITSLLRPHWRLKKWGCLILETDLQNYELTKSLFFINSFPQIFNHNDKTVNQYESGSK
jgi:hypothetical protein